MVCYGLRSCGKEAKWVQPPLCQVSLWPWPRHSCQTFKKWSDFQRLPGSDKIVWRQTLDATPLAWPEKALCNCPLLCRMFFSSRDPESSAIEMGRFKGFQGPWCQWQCGVLLSVAVRLSGWRFFVVLPLFCAVLQEGSPQQSPHRPQLSCSANFSAAAAQMALEEVRQNLEMKLAHVEDQLLFGSTWQSWDPDRYSDYDEVMLEKKWMAVSKWFVASALKADLSFLSSEVSGIG